MRTGITVAYTHKQPDRCRILFGPEVPIDKQRAEIKKLLGSKSHPEFQCLELYTLPEKSIEFITPEQAKRQDDAQAATLKAVAADTAKRNAPAKTPEAPAKQPVKV